MPALILDSCCFCIDLRTGSLIIGYLNLIANIVMIILGIVAMPTVGVVAGNIDQGVLVITRAILAIPVAFMILLMGFIIALLVGIHKNKRGHVKAYLIFSVVAIIGFILSFLSSFVRATSIASIVQQVFNIVLTIYSVLVIRSYYYKMREAAAPLLHSAQPKPNYQCYNNA